jgi:hypothetical protein
MYSASSEISASEAVLLACGAGERGSILGDKIFTGLTSSGLSIIGGTILLSVAIGSAITVSSGTGSGAIGVFTLAKYF